MGMPSVDSDIVPFVAHSAYIGDTNDGTVLSIIGYTGILESEND